MIFETLFKIKNLAFRLNYLMRMILETKMVNYGKQANNNCRN